MVDKTSETPTFLASLFRPSTNDIEEATTTQMTKLSLIKTPNDEVFFANFRKMHLRARSSKALPKSASVSRIIQSQD